jgi:2-desacetyl-2-hydroxyethyl bacteriochlorophyllide A dehydrogenase
VLFTKGRRIEMIQAKLTGIGEYICSEVPELASPKEGWAVVKTGAVGICGSDIHVYKGVNPVLVPPRIQGHEFSGVLKSLNGPSELKVGARVVVNPVVGCGHCIDCKAGKQYLCNEAYVIGGEVPGAFGGETYVPIRNLVPISDNLSFVESTIVEPTAVAVHTVGDVSNKTVLIIGQGTIGLLCLQVAKNQANKVIVVDVSDEMLAVSKKLGSDKTINSRTGDLDKELKDYLKGEPLDVIIDVVNRQKTVEFSIRSIRKGGLLIWVGIPLKEPFAFDLVTLLCNEIKIQTSYLYSEDDFIRAKNLVEQKAIDACTLVSKVFKLKDTAKAFEYKETVPSIKVVVEV